jgi:hypothetical protein
VHGFAVHNQAVNIRFAIIKGTVGSRSQPSQASLAVPAQAEGLCLALAVTAAQREAHADVMRGLDLA